MAESQFDPLKPEGLGEFDEQTESTTDHRGAASGHGIDSPTKTANGGNDQSIAGQKRKQNGENNPGKSNQTSEHLPDNLDQKDVKGQGDSSGTKNDSRSGPRSYSDVTRHGGHDHKSQPPPQSPVKQVNATYVEYLVLCSMLVAQY